MTCIKNELRIVRGNAFAVRLTIEARRLDGTVIDDFDLSQAEATLNVLHAGKKTVSTFTVTGNDATIAFNGTHGLGWYGLEMSGTYQGSPWRWCVNEIFQIVETNAKANVPSWTILADTTYLVDGVLTIASAADAVQADWNETNPQSASYIKNKPAVVSPTQLQQTVGAEKERAEAAERANADAIGTEEARAKEAEQANANAIAAKYSKPSGGIPSTDMTEAVQTSLQKAENAAPQQTTYTKDEVQQLIAPFITKSVDDLVNYYLKSEVYTQSEVQQLIAAVSQFRYQLAQTLPTASADTIGIIYLVPSTNPKTQNVKDEYITIDNGAEAQTRYTWEQIGSTAIDLSGYYTSAQTDTAITNALNAALASYYTKSQIDTMVQTINQAIAAKYTKPSGGIPSSDMSSSVQTSLQKADNAAPQATTYTKTETDTNFVGAPGQSVLAQAFAVLLAAIDGLKAQLGNLGETKAVSIDFEEQPKLCGQPLVIEGSGAPASPVVPTMVGQRYHDTTNRKVYEAFAVTNSVSDWVLLN